MFCETVTLDETTAVSDEMETVFFSVSLLTFLTCVCEETVTVAECQDIFGSIFTVSEETILFAVADEISGKFVETAVVVSDKTVSLPVSANVFAA